MILKMARIEIPKARLEFRFSRASGSGGQGVNRTESKVEIRFHVESADWIPFHVRERLKLIAAKQINLSGELIISSQESRSQNQNFEHCFEKLSDLLEKARLVPKSRRPTRATKASKIRRLDSKKKRSRHKAARKKPQLD